MLTKEREYLKPPNFARASYRDLSQLLERFQQGLDQAQDRLVVSSLCSWRAGVSGEDP